MRPLSPPPTLPREGVARSSNFVRVLQYVLLLSVPTAVVVDVEVEYSLTWVGTSSCSM